MAGIVAPDAWHKWLNVVEFWQQYYGGRLLSRDQLLDHFGQNYLQAPHPKEQKSAKWNSMNLANLLVHIFKCHPLVVFKENRKLPAEIRFPNCADF